MKTEIVTDFPAVNCTGPTRERIIARREAYDANWRDLQAQDRRAKQAGELRGRYITEPYADGKAVYIVTAVRKHKVRIRVATGLGDDWVIPYWGHETWIDKDYVEEGVNYRDILEKTFSGIDALIEEKERGGA